MRASKTYANLSHAWLPPPIGDHLLRGLRGGDLEELGPRGGLAPEPVRHRALLLADDAADQHLRVYN